MDYLQRLFNRELAAEGKIEIRGYEFDRDDVLQTMDSDAYTEAFEEWKSDRRIRLLKRGQDILNSLEDNKDWFPKLRVLFHKKVVIPFIGAGMSISSGFPGWRDFLLLVQKGSALEKNDMQEFKNLLNQGKYEDVAQLLANHDADYFQHKLHAKFGRDLSFSEINGVICRLPNFFNNHIATTNYDMVIERILQAQKIPFYPVNAISSSGLKQILAEQERVLLKLHGIHDSHKNRIITAEDYKWHYGDNGIIPDCIRDLCNYTLLFLGCSLSSDKTIEIMHSIVSEQGGDRAIRHYAFLSSKKLSNKKISIRRQKLQQANIFPIWYDGDHDEDIEALLELLNDGKETKVV